MHTSLPRALALAFSLTTASLLAGPTPYPAQNDEGAWPGDGPIRVMGYMSQNRDSFWNNREKNQEAVVFVGDSLMGSYKVKEAYPNLKVANLAIGGEVTRGLLFRLKEDVIDLHPKAVVICSGSNDLSCRTAPALAVKNLSRMVDELRTADPKVPIVFCLIPPRDNPKAPITEGSLQELNEGIKQIAANGTGIAVVDTFTPLAGPDGKPLPELFAPDKIHLAQPTYAKWTEIIQPALEKLGVK